MGTIGIIFIATACGGSAVGFLYGVLRRASRVSWTGIQVLLLFCYSLIIGAAPVPADGSMYFWLVTVFFAVALMLVLIFGGIIRRQVLLKTPTRKSKIAGRLIGGLLSALNILVLVMTLAGLVFGIVAAFPEPPALFADVLGSAFWQNFLSRHFYDLFLISVCFIFVRAGLRLGVLRGIYYLLMIALTLGGAIAAYMLTTRVGLFIGWSAGLAAKFGNLAPEAASVLGGGIMTLILFVILFAVIAVIGALLHWGIRKLLNVQPVGIVSDVLLGVLFFAIFLVFTLLFNWGISYLALNAEGVISSLLGNFSADAAGSAAGVIGPYMAEAGKFLSSSPLSAVFYTFNPLGALLAV